MRQRFLCLLLTLVGGTAVAAEVLVGEARLEIPTPAGFALLTPDVQPLYDVSIDMLTPQNRRLATFVDEKIIPAALSGKMPTFDRYINIETMRELENQNVSASEFAFLRKSIRAGIEEALAAIEGQLDDGMVDLSERVGETLDRKVAFSVSNMIPLPVHHSSQNSISNSMFVRYEIDSNGQTVEHIVSATTAFVHVKEKIVYVYVYGGEDQLEWTREQSKAWVADMLRMNAGVTADAE